MQIYSLCLRGLLRDWKEEKERRPIGDGYVEAVLEVLAPAAYALFAGGHEQFGEELLREKVRAALGGLGAGHELAGRDATSVIAELKHAGILITTGEHRDAPLLFLHRTFHEYLAARALARRAKSEGWRAIAALVDRKAWRPAWQEVIVLLAGQLADPLPLLRLLADERRDDLFRHRLALAALCLTEIPADCPRSARGGRDRDRDSHRLGEAPTRGDRGRRRASDAGFVGDRAGQSPGPRRDPLGHEASDPVPRYGSSGAAGGRRALGGLGASAAPALDRLLELSRDEDRGVRWAAAEALGGLGASAAPALDRLLELSRDEDRGVRRAAAEALGGQGASTAPALDQLLELSRDEDSGVRWAAAEALGGLGASAAPALDRLLELIRDEVSGVRWAAAKALGGLGASAAPALDRLLELIRDADQDVRRAAAEALGGLGASAAPALDQLLELIRDEVSGVRRAAAEALGGLGASAAPALDRLLELIRDEDEDVRRAAAKALGGLGASAAPALDRLLELTRDEDRGVRWAAAGRWRGLGASAAPALDRLLELIRDEDGDVRRAAAGRWVVWARRRPRPWTGSWS